MNLKGYTQVDINFSLYAQSMEEGEDFWLQVSTDGGQSYRTIETWESGIDFQNSVRDSVSVRLEGEFTDETQLRFRCDASSNSDQVYLDDIEITGCYVTQKGESAHNVLNTQKQSPLNDLSIFPNPAKDELSVQYHTPAPVDVNLQIVNMDGSVLMKQRTTSIPGLNNERIDLDQFSNGVYYLLVSHSHEHITKKFIIIE